MSPSSATVSGLRFTTLGWTIIISSGLFLGVLEMAFDSIIGYVIGGLVWIWLGWVPALRYGRKPEADAQRSED